MVEYKCIYILYPQRKAIEIPTLIFANKLIHIEVIARREV